MQPMIFHKEGTQKMMDEKTIDKLHILTQLQEAEARKAHSEDQLVELMNRHGVDEAIRRACVERVGMDLYENAAEIDRLNRRMEALRA